MEIREKIKAFRKSKGLTQEALAQKCGLATITIRQYELGKREPSIAQLTKIAAALGIRIEDLVGLETFDTGAEFDAEWKRRTQNATGPQIEVRHKANGEVQVIDPQREHLISTYDNLDEQDQAQLVKFGDILSSQSKYDEEPPQE